MCLVKRAGQGQLVGLYEFQVVLCTQQDEVGRGDTDDQILPGDGIFGIGLCDAAVGQFQLDKAVEAKYRLA